MQKPPVKPPSDMDLRRALAATMEQRRADLACSQEKLAELADLSTSYIGLLERGKRNMTMFSAARIAAALNLHLSDFVLLAEARMKPSSNKGSA